MKTVNVKNIDSYVIKNTHIDCDKDTHDILNDEMNIIMNEDMIIYFMWNEDKTYCKYSKSEDIN